MHSLHRRSYAHAVVLAEKLESRRLMSFGWGTSSAGKELKIFGHSDDNRIVLSKSGSNYVITDFDKTIKVPSASVQKLIVELDDGADSFTTTNAITLGITVDGGSENDTITTGGGADSIIGGTGNDRLNGGDGADTVYGGSGNDSLYGNGGKDQLYDELGKDSCYGGSGNDTLHADYHATDADLYDGGDGTDMMKYGEYSNLRLVGVTITNDGVANDGIVNGFKASDEKDNVLPNIEDFYATHKDDRVILTGNGKNYVYAGPGNDYVSSGGGDDTVYLYYGNDLIYAGDGNDTVYGDWGDDFLYGEAGNDSLIGGFGNDIIAGYAGNDFISGNDGKDSLYGNEGADTLTGGDGYDQLSGGNDNDLLFAIDGNAGEKVDGGSGFDIAHIDKITNNFYPFFTPIDTLIGVEQWV